MTDDENVVPTKHNKIMVLNGQKCNMDIINRDIQILQDIAKNRDKYQIIEQLKKIVPEYKPA